MFESCRLFSNNLQIETIETMILSLVSGYCFWLKPKPPLQFI